MRKETSMKPIPFNTEMVQAILDWRKTATRLVVKPQFALDADGKKHAFGGVDGNMFIWADKPNIKAVIHPPYQPGDILYVQETWCLNNFGWHYRADWSGDNCSDMGADDKWHSPICMPKEAARLFLRVTDVRVERLQDITLEDIVREGIFDACVGDDFIRCAAYLIFENKWDCTIKIADLPRYGWDANPWVWVIEFERISKESALEGGHS